MFEEKNKYSRMGDREERHEERHKERWEERWEGRHKERRARRYRIPRRRVRDSPLNLQGEQHELPILPKGTFKTFLGDIVIDPKIHVDLFLDVCDFHVIEDDDVMVRLFLQTLVGKAYEWYTSLPKRLIGSLDDIERMFLNMFSPLVAYHNRLTSFTQICLRKNERIQDFNLRFNKTLNKILEGKRPNALVVLDCYKNATLMNVKFSIRAS